MQDLSYGNLADLAPDMLRQLRHHGRAAGAEAGGEPIRGEPGTARQQQLPYAGIKIGNRFNGTLRPSFLSCSFIWK